MSTTQRQDKRFRPTLYMPVLSGKTHFRSLALFAGRSRSRRRKSRYLDGLVSSHQRSRRRFGAVLGAGHDLSGWPNAVALSLLAALVVFRTQASSGPGAIRSASDCTHLQPGQSHSTLFSRAYCCSGRGSVRNPQFMARDLASRADVSGRTPEFVASWC